MMNTWITTKSKYRVIQVLSGRCNVFLLTDGKTNILIDTSIGMNQKKLFKQLKKLKIENIDYLILTHTHFDHAANAHAVKSKFNSQVIVHYSESGLLKTGKAVLPRGTNFFTRNLIQSFGNKIACKFNFTPCESDIEFESYYSLKNIGFNAYLLHTSGHSVGSISLIVDDEIVMAGDALFGIFRGSIFPPFADDTKELVKSWGKLLDTGCSIFLPSHGFARNRELLEKVYKKRKTIL